MLVPKKLKPHYIQSSRVLVPAGTSKSTLRRHGIQAVTRVMVYVADAVTLTLSSTMRTGGFGLASCARTSSTLKWLHQIQCGFKNTSAQMTLLPLLTGRTIMQGSKNLLGPIFAQLGNLLSKFSYSSSPSPFYWLSGFQYFQIAIVKINVLTYFAHLGKLYKSAQF
jgi:hypothetical protein